MRRSPGWTATAAPPNLTLPAAATAVSLAISLSLFIQGCGSWLPAPVPMRAVDHPAPEGRARCLIVFLPGRGDKPEYFAERGFVEEFRRRDLSVDMVAADASLGYYLKGVFAERLSTDVVEPRRKRGYEQLWLVGMSIGGYGTFLYSRQRPHGGVHGVLALAPYIADADLIEEVEEAGGLKNWKAPPRADTIDASNFQSEVMRWLKMVAERREPGPELYLAYGLDDRLARGNALIGAALPPDRVFTMPGGHKWVVWHKLLTRFLDSEALAGCRGHTDATPEADAEIGAQVQPQAAPPDP